MLAFVVPLKSRRVSNDWNYVSQLFERTLRSICAQTSSEFKVIVVHHEKPAIGFSHPAVTYVPVDYPVPDRRDHPALILDKYRKRLRGFMVAREFSPSHMMPVDADDCLSRRLAAWVDENSAAPGWYFDIGYFHRDGTRRVFLRRRGFHDWCGTSRVFRTDLLALPAGDDFDDAGVAAFRPWQLTTRLAALPFPGAVYVLGRRFEGTHSRRNYWADFKENPRVVRWHARKLFDELLHSEPLTPALSAEFGVYPINDG